MILSIPSVPHDLSHKWDLGGETLKVEIHGSPKEIAALVVALQGRQMLKTLSPKEMLSAIFGGEDKVNLEVFAQSIGDKGQEAPEK